MHDPGMSWDKITLDDITWHGVGWNAAGQERRANDAARRDARSEKASPGGSQGPDWESVRLKI